jgi:carboxypeptidase PM20D1
MSKDGGPKAAEPPAKRQGVRRVLRYLVRGIALLLVILVPLLVIKAAFMQTKQPLVQAVTVPLPDSDAMARRLAAAIALKTVSAEDATASTEPFLALHAHLQSAFPRVHQALVREPVAEYSLLYTWQGKNKKLAPLLLAAHLDVVPARAERWSHNPWSGDIADGYVYGRGALDDKANVLGILEAAEQLLSEGFQPERTIYFAFGHDEEIGGYHGAKAIAALLASRGVALEAVIDEGLVITEGILPGLDPPLAIIGISEKGYVTVELTASGQGGHSSIPPKKTAIGILSQAIVNLEANPMPGALSGAVEAMFRYVGPELPFARKLVVANLWLFRGLVESSLEKSQATAALLRTTTAPTMLDAGVKSNVLAQRARAVVNFRVKPGDTVEQVLAHVRRVIDNKNVAVKALDSVEAQHSSSTESRIFSIMQRSIRRVDPSIVVAPGLMLAMTDSRHYQGITTDIYRFSALRFGPEDLARLHGVDERVSIESYAELVAFQILLLKDASQ